MSVSSGYRIVGGFVLTPVDSILGHVDRLVAVTSGCVEGVPHSIGFSHHRICDFAFQDLSQSITIDSITAFEVCELYPFGRVSIKLCLVWILLSDTVGGVWDASTGVVYVMPLLGQLGGV